MTYPNILLVSLSNNYDHQMSLYSMYVSLKQSGLKVFTLGIVEPKFKIDFSNDNIFLDAPKRPGFSFKAVRIGKLKNVLNFIKKNSISVVYFESLHIWNIRLMKKIKKQNKNCRIYHCIHDVVPHSGKLSFLVSIFNKIICKKADKVILRSEYSLLECKKILPQFANKMRYFPIVRMEKEYIRSTHSRNVLFFGRLTKYKGLNNLVSIVESLPSVTFYVAGRPLTKKDKKIANKLSDFKNVRLFDSYVAPESMDTLFKNCDVTILPYESATQSGVIVDSYGYSRPCIAFDVGAISEQIIDGKTGYLVKSSVELFSKKITEFISLTNEEIDALSYNAYVFFKKHYSSEGLLTSFKALLLEHDKSNINGGKL